MPESCRDGQSGYLLRLYVQSCMGYRQGFRRGRGPARRYDCHTPYVGIESVLPSAHYILPDRFVRIRHYGFLSPCNREVLRSIQLQLDVPPVPKVRSKKSYLEICIEKGWDIGICKDCNCQRIITRIIKPAPRAPPYLLWRLVK